jgi:hypothetical protein
MLPMSVPAFAAAKVSVHDVGVSVAERAGRHGRVDVRRGQSGDTAHWERDDPGSVAADGQRERVADETRGACGQNLDLVNGRGLVEAVGQDLLDALEVVDARRERRALVGREVDSVGHGTNTVRAGVSLVGREVSSLAYLGDAVRAGVGRVGVYFSLRTEGRNVVLVDAEAEDGLVAIRVVRRDASSGHVSLLSSQSAHARQEPGRMGRAAWSHGR